MATYVISDIHGEYDMFVNLLDKISFNDQDTLYILGDVVDRGPHPIKMLIKLMEMPNAVCLAGNHELMAIEAMDFLMKEITEESVAALDEKTIGNYTSWIYYNGGQTTLDEFKELDPVTKRDVYEFIREFLIYEELSIANRDYLLVHAGLGNYYPGKEIEEYSLKKLVWDRAEYDIQYFDNKYVITGHTPTQTISGNTRPGYIYKEKNHIAIDCGCCRRGGHLAAICLDTLEEYYVSRCDK